MFQAGIMPKVRMKINGDQIKIPISGLKKSSKILLKYKGMERELRFKKITLYPPAMVAVRVGIEEVVGAMFWA